jgi:hypothetical protein
MPNEKKCLRFEEKLLQDKELLRMTEYGAVFRQ